MGNNIKNLLSNNIHLTIKTKKLKRLKIVSLMIIAVAIFSLSSCAKEKIEEPIKQKGKQEFLFSKTCIAYFKKTEQELFISSYLLPNCCITHFVFFTIFFNTY